MAESKEKVIQQHIFDHLWLLDPSWERASTDEKMEVMIGKEWREVISGLSAEEKRARLDIKYRTAAGKHIAIELKKYGRKVSIIELLTQVQKYRRAMTKVLSKVYPDENPVVEIVCILGSKPEPADDDERNVGSLKQQDARYITYDQLIRQTRDSYRDYLDRQKKITRIQQIVDQL